MIIIGELINASRKAIGSALEAQDAAAIQKVVQLILDIAASVKLKIKNKPTILEKIFIIVDFILFTQLF